MSTRFRWLHYTPILIALLVLGAQSVAAAPASAARNSWLAKIARFFGITVTPDGQKGVRKEDASGDLYYVADWRKRDKPSPLTQNGSYRSPIFRPGDREVLALMGERLFSIPLGGGPAKELCEIKGVVKLVGADPKKADEILILTREDEKLTPAVLSLSRKALEKLPLDVTTDEEKEALSYLEGWDRSYEASTPGGKRVTLYVTLRSRPLPGMKLSHWTDVYLQEGNDELVNISRSRDVRCGQPSLSHDRQGIVYVRERS